MGEFGLTREHKGISTNFFQEKEGGDSCKQLNLRMKRLQQVSVLSTICQRESSNLAKQGEFRDCKVSFAAFCSKLVFQYIPVFKVHVNPAKWKALQDAFKRSIYAVGNHRISTLLEQRSSVWEMYFAELESLRLLNWQFVWLTIHMIKLWYLYRQNHTRGHNRLANCKRFGITKF